MGTQSNIEYQVQLNPKSLEMTVKMDITGDLVRKNEGELVLEIPTWVPGDYAFEPYGRDIFSVKAQDHSGTPLKVKRKGFNGYLVEVNGNPITVTYEASAYEPELGDAMGLVDSEYAILMGTRYLFCPNHPGSCSVDYGTLPNGWKIHHPSGAKRSGNSNKWTYPSFEILLDTPVSFGNFDLLKRTIKGTPFYFLFVDKGIGFETKVDQFVDQLTVAAEKIHDVFGMFPFDDYTFVLSLNPQADWGLEHLTSNMSGLGPEVFVDDNWYATGIRVCAHELFHAWNVRRLRPAPLGQLCHHLTTGSFTEGLWVAEGFTRYYEFLISTRAKAYSPDQFFSAIAGYFQHLTQQPSYSRVPVTDSSLATYMNHSKYPGRVNNSIDYYDKGMLIAFGLDARFRSLNISDEYSSLDDAFSTFYFKYFGEGHKVPSDYVGYTTEDVISFFGNIHPDLGKALQKQVEEAGNLDTVTQFRNIGFEVDWEETNCLGLFFLNNSEPTIYGVGDNSPAGEVGIAPNDVIQTINGYAFTQKGLVWAAAQNEDVNLEVLRGHRKLTFTISPKPFKKLKQLRWKGSTSQVKSIQQWLGEENFQPSQGQIFELSFYDNFHGLESMV
ncbi:MAG: PDZ domain-containing protein [Bacteroidetes bacterium]|nr:PDZ domain-containing protein [Bacteroidota bacterium]